MFSLRNVKANILSNTLVLKANIVGLQFCRAGGGGEKKK